MHDVYVHVGPDICTKPFNIVIMIIVRSNPVFIYRVSTPQVYCNDIEPVRPVAYMPHQLPADFTVNLVLPWLQLA